jgi:2-deoxy-D-gluconate 3-dehydrogenase
VNDQSFRLDGKVALVTGASTGLGQAIAVGFARAGADVAGVGRSDFGDTAAAVTGAGRRFQAIRADLGGRA